MGIVSFHGQNRSHEGFVPPTPTDTMYNWVDVKISYSGKYIIGLIANTYIINQRTSKLCVSNNYGSSFPIILDSYDEAELTPPANGAVGVSSTGKYMMSALLGSKIRLSIDYGNTFLTLTNSPELSWRQLEVSDDGLHMYAAEPGGFWRSLDYGVTWVKILDNIISGQFAISENGDKVYVVTGTSPSGRLQMSYDYGINWVIALGGDAYDDELPGVTSVSCSSNGDNVVCQTWNGVSTNKIYTSIDSGTTEFIEKYSTSAFAFEPILEMSNNGSFILTRPTNSTYALYSNDFGTTWNNTVVYAGTYFNKASMAKNKPNTQVYDGAGEWELFLTNNNGTTFYEIGL